jgi:hypothetical protein
MPPAPDQTALFDPTDGDVVDETPPAVERPAPRAVLDPEVLFAPETIAAHRAHVRQCRGRHDAGEICPAVIDPEDLAAVRSGRARMARARRAAGVELNRGDRAALEWADREQGPGR